MTNLELDPVEQKALLDEVTDLVQRSAPQDWSRLAVEYKAIGRHVQVGAGAKNSAGELVQWAPPEEVWNLLWRLRVGMHRPRLGTWFSPFYRLNPPADFEIVYNRDNPPQWHDEPPLRAYTDEQAMFPRDEPNLPAWFADKLRAAEKAS
ncbi:MULTISPECIES: hypothetical protein [unclassified Saccharopolyspora]|uniref:hypothetical protein n=1 Tax=unclassified Saccharopolyspora TaxID=2646250 RepID=UPI001CD783F4|nr:MULTISPECIES: hypothetical protein [unclassified Saccharopolyspora]MCA1186953.1 hypothetical protein [Saccharopolyspora sp. 6T]MCA1192668.1 hypothetical protein [Saccharopolyspora sp. 6V]MCA1227768.1 hypothetical protein [Saccharopolyspora sp. 6M]MCA1281820.1 hypothetical protein [Saccharopolyspora sp. 7B]